MSPTSRHSPSAAFPTPSNARSASRNNVTGSPTGTREEIEACHTGPPKFASSHS